ncbi:hypothetical protein CASFOL_011995 [Castilleja foliolosa]|uniref:Replication factor A C-terminal domain-containing protein n=1 Tax=Castilleja foliolosa TaxID=1961234 RepID=A0ABD3DP41_9LAMI
MAHSSNTLFSAINDLNSGSTAWAIKARVVRLYKQSSYLNRSETWSVEMVIHDQQGTRIHVTIRPDLYEKFKNVLSEGSLYMIKNFFVIENRSSYRSTNNRHKLALFRASTIIEYEDDQFPSNMFDITPLDQLQMEMDIDETLLRDVIGRVISYQKFEGFTARKMDFRIQDPENNQLSCTLWDDYIDDLLPILETTKDKPVIVLLQFGKVVKLADGVKISNNYQITKVTVNADSDVFTDFMNRLNMRGDAGFNRVLSNTNYSIYEDFTNGKAQVNTIANLIGLQDDELMWIDATIVDFHVMKDFWYAACKNCSKKLVVHPGTTKCSLCAFDNPIQNIRFKLELIVVDKSGTGTVILWNKSSELLIGQSAAELKQIYGDFPVTVPKEIEDAVINKRVLFELKLATFKMVRGIPNWNVGRIAYDDEIMEIYKKLPTVTQDSTSDEHGTLTELSSPENVDSNSKKLDKGKRKLFIELDEQEMNDDEAKADETEKKMQPEDVTDKTASGNADAVYTSKKKKHVIKKEK